VMGESGIGVRCLTGPASVRERPYDEAAGELKVGGEAASTVERDHG